MEVKVEWEFIVAVFVVLGATFWLWHGGILPSINVLFVLGGTLFIGLVFLTYPEEAHLGKLVFGSFLLQLAVMNLALGAPAIRGVPPPSLHIPITQLLIQTSTEEIFRIGAYYAILFSFSSPFFAVISSGLVFAVMHVWWYPTQWIGAIVFGALFSVMLMVFNSPLSCIGSHFMYDGMTLLLVPIPAYFAVSLTALTLGGLLYLKKVETGI